MTSMLYPNEAFQVVQTPAGAGRCHLHFEVTK